MYIQLLKGKGIIEVQSIYKVRLNPRTRCLLATHDSNMIAHTRINLVQIHRIVKSKGKQDKSSTKGT